jgi:hypothetical protein
MGDIIRQLTDEIARKEAKIVKAQTELVEAQAELAELNTALRVLRRIQGDDLEQQGSAEAPDEPGQAEPFPAREGFSSLLPSLPTQQDLEGSTIFDACVTVLRENAAKGRPNVHYKDVAAEARRRGYRGRSDKALEQSFWAIMNRQPEVFKPMGGGAYTLAERFNKKSNPEGNENNDA